MENRTPVLVLGSSHHGDLGIARSLGRIGVPVFIVDSDPHAPALKSRYCRQHLLWRFDGSSPAESIQFLRQASRKL